jgi:hypothetical protein
LAKSLLKRNIEQKVEIKIMVEEIGIEKPVRQEMNLWINRLKKLVMLA